MAIFKNIEILWRDAYILKNDLTMKTKIAFMLNLEIPITAMATAKQPRLLCRWNLQEGGHNNFCFLKKSVCHLINASYDFSSNLADLLDVWQTITTWSYREHLSDGKQISQWQRNPHGSAVLPVQIPMVK